MPNKKLSDIDIKRLLQEGRNFKRLYYELKPKFDEVKAENKQLRELLIQALAKIDTQAIQIAELQAMVFGKSKQPPTGNSGSGDLALPKPKPPRSQASYRRPLPRADAITATVVLPVNVCACGGELTNITEHDRYVEDIPLPELTPNYTAKLVTKYVVQRGICVTCGKARSGQDLGGAIVSLGLNIRLLVCHLVTTLGMSYAQVASLLLSLYGLNITDGEIANILTKQHVTWQPAYQQLKADIRAAPAVHADETPWPIQGLQGGGYGWVLADATSPKVCYALENSRGARHAKSLFGDTFNGIRISDDYGVYRSLPGEQQLCWAHLYRCIRDLRYNNNLPEEQLPYVKQWHEQFAEIYADLRAYLADPYDKDLRLKQTDELWERIQALLETNPSDPTKLTKLKNQLTRAGQSKLLVCLVASTPCDNNRAERDLRGLVIKRKRSFGSKTEQGAQALATVLSICTTTWRMNPTGYFKALAAI